MSEQGVSDEMVRLLAELEQYARDCLDPNMQSHLALDLLAARAEIERLKGEGGASLLEMDDEEFEELLQSMREMREIARIRGLGAKEGR